MHTKTKTSTESLKIMKVHKTKKKSTKTETPPQNGQQPKLLGDFIVFDAWCSHFSQYLLIGGCITQTFYIAKMTWKKQLRSHIHKVCLKLVM